MLGEGCCSNIALIYLKTLPTDKRWDDVTKDGRFDRLAVTLRLTVLTRTEVSLRLFHDVDNILMVAKG